MRTALGLLVLSVTVACGAPSALAEEDGPPVVVVSAQAKIAAVPDEARLVFAVRTENKEAEVAVAQNASRVEAVLAAVRKRLGAGGKIRTLGYSLQPQHVYPERGKPPKVVGYIAQNRVEIVTGDLDAVGKLIDAGTSAGANQVESLSFGLADELPVRLEALREAAIRARSKANTLAEALDRSLGEIRSVTEGGAPVRPLVRHAESRMLDSAAAVATPVEPGEIEVRATVTLEVALR